MTFCLSKIIRHALKLPTKMLNKQENPSTAVGGPPPFRAREAIKERIVISMKEWQKAAEHLYFTEHKKIVEVAEIIGVTRQTVSRYLKSCPGWVKEQEARKHESAVRRKRQKERWELFCRSEPNLKREHAQAVAELSAERYH